jgi:peptide subunit release factor 1 (eRF1)
MFAKEELRALTHLKPPILTICLNTMRQDHSRFQTLDESMAWLHKEVDFISRGLLPRDARNFGRETQRIQDFLQARHPREKALVIFSGHETWKVVPLPSHVENQIYWGRPAIGTLFRLLSEYKTYGVVVVDHQAARFFEYFAGQLALLAEKEYRVDKSQWKRGDVAHVSSGLARKAQGPGRDLVNDRIEVQYEHLCKEIADQMWVFTRELNFTGVLVVGPQRLVGATKKNFPGSFQARVVLVPEDLAKLSATKILRRLEPVIANCEAVRQSTEVKNALAGNRGSIIEADEAIARLQGGTLRSILIAGDLEFHLHQCEKCGLVNRSADNVCPVCGGPRRNVDLLDVLPQLAATHGTEVEFVTGEAAQTLTKAGGVAGWERQRRKAVAG